MTYCQTKVDQTENFFMARYKTEKAMMTCLEEEKF